MVGNAVGGLLSFLSSYPLTCQNSVWSKTLTASCPCSHRSRDTSCGRFSSILNLTPYCAPATPRSARGPALPHKQWRRVWRHWYASGTLDDLVFEQPRGKIVEHDRDRNPCALDAGLAVAEVRISRYMVPPAHGEFLLWGKLPPLLTRTQASPGRKAGFAGLGSWVQAIGGVVVTVGKGNLRRSHRRPSTGNHRGFRSVHRGRVDRPVPVPGRRGSGWLPSNRHR
jgi:hypothetical protein